MSKIILASKSPRRAEILSNLGVVFTAEPSDVDETVMDGILPCDAVVEISRRKALFALSQHPERDVFVISADTVVTFGKDILGKPKDKNDAVRILTLLSGKTHTVCTGFTLCTKETCVSECVSTKVTFRELSEKEILHYVESGEPMDKAGAYGIQGKGAVFVEGIEGDYFNVVGLPVCRLVSAAKSTFGIDIAGF